jgi:hypothetical protein
MGLQLTVGLFALQLALAYSIIPIASSLLYGLRTGTVYVYQLAYPPELQNTDPSYQVITKKDLDKLDEDTRQTLIDTYGDDVMIISNKNKPNITSS